MILSWQLLGYADVRALQKDSDMWKMFLACVLVVIIAAPVGAAEIYSRDGWEQAFSRRNIKLGISLQEFKTIPFPDTSKYHYKKPHPVCSNAVPSSKYIGVKIYGNLKIVGVIKCAYFGSWTYLKSKVEKISPLLLRAGPDTDYYFMKPEDEENYLLYQIYTEHYKIIYMDVLEAFHTSFGKPQTVRTPIVQNRLGAKFENTISIWENVSSRMLITRYAGQLDRFSILHNLKSLSKIVESRINLLKSEDAKKL